MSGRTDPGPAPNRGERLALVGIWGLLALTVTGGAFGRITPDTKLALVHDPLRFLGRSLSAWDPTATFGGLQNQSVGYLLPMGAFTAVTRSIGIPIWLTQRLWLALLLGVALSGMHRLVRELGVDGPVARVTAAVVYALAPSFLMVLSYHGGTALPHAFAPWVLVPLLRHGVLGPRRAALRSAAAVAAMGGINAASTVAVLPLAVGWFLTRRPGPQRRRLAAWWIGGVLAATAWWLLPFLISIRHGFDFTPFTEQIGLTARTQSATDAWRGTGHWLTYIDQGGRTLQPGARGLVLDRRAIAGSMAIVIAGAAGLGRRDAPGRRWLVLTASVGAIALAAAYTGPGNAGPLSEPLRALLGGPLIAFRNLHKFAPLVQLPLAVGVGHTVAVIGRRLGSVGRTIMPAAAATVVLASIAPIIPGRIFLPGSFAELPAAWREAAAWADAADDPTRTLLLPGAISADHLWGHPQDEPFALLSDGPWAVRDLIPLGGNASTRILDGIDDVLRSGEVPAGFVPTLRRAGIGRIVVRNDLTPDGDGAPSPETIRAVLRSVEGIEPGPSFGPVIDPGETIRDDRIPPVPPDAAGDGTDPDDDRPGGAAGIRRIDTYVVTEPVRHLEVLDADSVVALGGGPEAMLALPPELVGNRAIVLADDRGGLRPALTITTDTARHRDVLFGGIRSNRSPTLTEDADSPLTGDPPRDRWPDPAPPPRTVAVLDGAAELVESGPIGWRPPGRHPAAAFDGNPDTVWVPHAPTVGHHLEVRFATARSVPAVRAVVPSVDGRHVEELHVTTDAGTRSGRVDRDGGFEIELDPEPTAFVRIEIGAVGDGPITAPVGLSEIELDGTVVSRPLRTASPSPDGPEPADIAILDRARVGPGSVTGMDEDGILDRLLLLRDGPKRAEGTASAIGGPELTELLESLRPPPERPAPVVTGDGWHRLPGHGADAAFDGRPDTFWAADPRGGTAGRADIRWSEPVTVDSIEVDFTGSTAAAAPIDVEIGVTIDGERTVHRPTAAGRIELGSAVTTDRVVLDARAGGVSTGRPVAIGAIRFPGAPSSMPPIPDEAAIELGCGRGPDLTVDGITVPTSLTTTAGGIRRGEPARWEACEEIGADGEMRFRAPHDVPFRIDTAIITPSANDPMTATVTPPERDLRIERWGSQERRFRIGPGDAVVVAGTENRNDGWTVGGIDGARTLRIDGWRQGQLIPASTESATITLSYAPTRWFRAGIGIGLVLLVGVLIGAFASPRRAGPRRRHRDGRVPALLGERSLPPAGATVLAVVVGALLGGLTAVAVVPLVMIERRRPDIARWIAPAALGIVAVCLLVPFGIRWASTNAAFHLPAQTAAVVAWMAFALRTADPPDPPAARPDPASR